MNKVPSKCKSLRINLVIALVYCCDIIELEVTSNIRGLHNFLFTVLHSASPCYQSYTY